MNIKKIESVLWNIIINNVSSSYLFSQKMRLKLYKILNVEIKGNVSPGVYFGNRNIKIDKGSFINKKCYFDERASIKIGENCFLGPEVMICTSTHKIESSPKRAGELVEKSVKINSGCWIGARSTILPGVTIDQGCVIAAGSVVISNCEKNGLYAGVPAKRIKDL